MERPDRVCSSRWNWTTTTTRSTSSCRPTTCRQHHGDAADDQRLRLPVEPQGRTTTNSDYGGQQSSSSSALRTTGATWRRATCPRASRPSTRPGTPTPPTPPTATRPPVPDSWGSTDNGVSYMNSEVPASPTSRRDLEHRPHGRDPDRNLGRGDLLLRPDDDRPDDQQADRHQRDQLATPTG